MNFTTDRAPQPSASEPAAGLVSPARLFALLVAASLALVLFGELLGHAAMATDEPDADLPVGHTVKQMTVTGSAGGEQRVVDVHIWYPADPRGFNARTRTVYTSALHGLCSSTPDPPPAPCPAAPPKIPQGWTPLSWTIEAQVAREHAPIDPHGPAFPVIVFSHGSTNDPIDYAYTLERIAAAGFVVAAPSHTNNTQDDARRDYINQQAGQRLFDCKDGLVPRPIPPGRADCSKTDVPSNMADRVRDITYVLDDLPGWFGDRVDVSRAGVMGHSRGTVTALTAAGGSAPWSPALNCAPPEGQAPVCWPGVVSDPRLKAVMGMAIGAEAITFGANLASVKVPTVLVAGGRDQNPSNPRPALKVSQDAFQRISSSDKLFVAIPNATHRSFDSTYCAQLQSAAAVAKSDPNALLDLHTVGLIAASAPGFLSGKAVHYCAPQFFTTPVNIQQVVASTFNAEYSCSDTGCGLSPPVAGAASPCVTDIVSIPCTGLDTEEVKQGIVKIAVAFFHSALDDTPGIDFEHYLAPKWLIQHLPMVGSAQAYAGRDSICRPAQSVVCADS